MLDRIIASKQAHMDMFGNAIMDEFAHAAALPVVRDFAAFMDSDRPVRLIAEVKKASPSKGLFLPDFDPVGLARTYQTHGAAAVSVITEEYFFLGNPHFIANIKKEVSLPLLRKDFIIDERQIYESRLLEADAVLLIARLLSGRLLSMVELSLSLGLESLVEVHDADELKQALDTPVRLIGINNRNLQDFSVNIGVCLDLIAMIPNNKCCIAESGILTPQDMMVLEKYGFKGALVGEALVTAADIGAKVNEMVNYRDFHYDKG